MTPTEIITAAVALYGAILSTVTIVLHKREKRQKIKVKLWLGFVGNKIAGIKNVVLMEAANAGSVQVYLANYSYYLPDSKKKLVGKFESDKPIPCTLAPGEGVQVWFDSKKFVDLIKAEGFEKEVTVAAEFSNKAGRVFRSKPEKLELSKLLYAKENSS